MVDSTDADRITSQSLMGSESDMSRHSALPAPSNTSHAERGRSAEQRDREPTAEGCHLQAGGPKEDE